MKKLHQKAMLLIAAAVPALVFSSCDKGNGDCDDPDFTITNSLADYYFKPKKLNIIGDGNKQIYGDWIANKNIGQLLEKNIGQIMDVSELLDYGEEYAEHYFFLDDSGIKKYASLSEATNMNVFIDKKDFQSPYKEYAEYWGDTLVRSRHGVWLTIDRLGYFCVLPITGIDVWCDKDFDANHPAGTNLNDIMFWKGHMDYYAHLKERDQNGNLTNEGSYDSKFYSDYRYYIRNIPLSDLPSNPLVMAEHAFSLGFNTKPSNPGAYEFTVKFTFGPDPLSGEVVDVPSAKVSIDF